MKRNSDTHVVNESEEEQPKKLQKTNHKLLLNTLPFTNDLIANIFTFLDPATELLPRLMPVCRRFYNILGGNCVDDDGRDSKHYDEEISLPFKSLIYEKIKLQWKDIASYHFRSSFDSNYFVRLVGYVERASCGGVCKKLILGNQNELSGVTIEFSMEFFKRLRDSSCFDEVVKLSFSPQFSTFLLTLSAEDLKIVGEWLRRLKNLERLILAEPIPQSLMNDLLKGCTRLRHLSISADNTNIGVDGGVGNLLSLEYLDFTSAEVEPSPNFFTKTPNLKRIKLGYGYCFDKHLFKSIQENCLEMADFSFGERYMNESGNLEMLLGMKKLEKIDLEDSLANVDDVRNLAQQFKHSLKQFLFEHADDCEEDITDIFQLLAPNLEHANASQVLYKFGEQDDEGISLLDKCKSFPKIKSLGLSENDLGDDAIGKLFQELRHLEVVFLDVDTTVEEENKKDCFQKALQLIHGLSDEKCAVEMCTYSDTSTICTEYEGSAMVRLRVKLVNFGIGSKFKISRQYC